MISRAVTLAEVEIVRPARTLRAIHRRNRLQVDTLGLSFGDRVRAIREKRGLTQLELAEMAGLSVGPIRGIEWERGKAVQAETLARVASALGVTMDALWTGETR